MLGALRCFAMIWKTHTRQFDLSQRGLIMGVLNVTSDSFSDGGQFLDPARALVHARSLLDAGADVLVNAFGERRMAWAMALTGFIVGIPLFYGVGFVLMVPIIFAVVDRYRLPTLVVALPALAALSVAHGLLPPHPAPTALVASFKADIGLTLLYGLAVAVPALVLAGPVFARLVASIPARPLAGMEAKALPVSQLPSAAISILTALLPAVPPWRRATSM
jgi:H+/gluconate symporter-like permease